MSAERVTSEAITPEHIDQQVTAARVRLIDAQVRTAPLATMCADGLIVWLLAREGLGAWVWPWYVLCVLSHGIRPLWFSRVARHPEGREQWLVMHTHVFMGLFGLLRLVLVPIAFSLPLNAAHYAYTMVFTGIAAGIVITAAGSPKIYATWLLPPGLALSLAWMSQRTFEGAAVGLLLLTLYAVLLRNVREQGRMLRGFVTLAAEKEQLAMGLRQERDRAQAANESKTRFFAAANHDLRQPLHALALNAAALEMVARQEGGLVRELSAGISRSLAQSNALLDNLLDISRLDARAVQECIEPLHVGTLLQHLRDEQASVAAHAGLSLRVELGSSEETSASLWVLSDELLLRRVLGNLLSNALKFTRHGGVVLSARRLPGQDRVEILVEDSGPGIAPENLDRVFEEFFQVANQSRDRSQGLGLGLSIVKRVCALLGIELGLHSRHGEGTRVSLCLPSARPELGKTAAPLRLPELPQPNAPPLNARVLAIDDEPDVRRSLELLLPTLGCEVRCAAGSQAALAHLHDGYRPNLLLVDHRLRDETGIDLIHLLRMRLGPVPAILITGDTSPDHIQKTMSIGSCVLHKPLEGRRLHQAMSDLLAVQPRPT